MLEVKIDDDPLPLDNRRWMAVPVKEALRVLLVDGHYKTEPFEAETDYLAQALSPAESAQSAPTPIKVEVIADVALSRRELAPYDVVALCNVGQFRESEVAALEAYLKQGGGVVVFGGEQVVAGELQPAPLRRRQGAAARVDRRRRSGTPRRSSPPSSSTRSASHTRSSANSSAPTRR